MENILLKASCCDEFESTHLPLPKISSFARKGAKRVNAEPKIGQFAIERTVRTFQMLQKTGGCEEAENYAARRLDEITQILSIPLRDSVLKGIRNRLPEALRGYPRPIQTSITKQFLK